VKTFLLYPSIVIPFEIHQYFMKLRMKEIVGYVRVLFKIDELTKACMPKCLPMDPIKAQFCEI